MEKKKFYNIFNRCQFYKTIFSITVGIENKLECLYLVIYSGQAVIFQLFGHNYIN
jgi:hypothetical protein